MSLEDKKPSQLEDTKEKEPLEPQLRSSKRIRKLNTKYPNNVTLVEEPNIKKLSTSKKHVKRSGKNS